jgi:hypothetical protein
VKTTDELAPAIREHAARTYVRSAKQRGLKRFTIRAGDVHRDMRFKENRVPAVCSALKSKKFLAENGLQLVERSGPPSGLSPTVTYTYEFVDLSSLSPEQHPFFALRGIAKDVFAALGGGEHFIRAEREAWERPREDKGR